ADATAQLAEVDREIRRSHELAEHLVQRPLGLGRTEHVECGAGAIGGREEGQALHMVPVEVRDERRAVERAVSGLGHPESTQARAEIEDDRVLALDFERDTRSVATVTLVLLARTGARTPDSVEGRLHVPP